MDLQKSVVEKKSSLEWFLHKRFVTIGVIMGVLMVLCSTIIIGMSFMLRNVYREVGDNSKGWIPVAGLAFGVFAIVIIVIVDIILNKMAMAVIKKIKIPLDDISTSIQDLSQGNLDTVISYTERDEFGTIVENTTATIIELKKYITNISEILTQMSDKNMAMSVDIDYVGDFLPIKESIENIIDAMNSLLGGVLESMNVIRTGAKKYGGNGILLSRRCFCTE